MAAPSNQQLEDTSQIIRAYAMMVLGFPMAFIPMPILSGVGLLLMVVGIIYTYTVKKKLATSVVGRNHVQWILRTFWIASIYFLAGAVVAWMVVAANADAVAIEQLSHALEAGTATPDEITLMITEFQTTNAQLMGWSKIISFAPCLIFFALRFIKGYRLAEDYKEVPNVKTWLI